MPIIEEQQGTYPAFWVSKDTAPGSGQLRGITGFRVTNNTPVRIRVRITFGPQSSVINWWTPLGRADDTIAVGESVTSQAFSVPAGQADSFSVSIGEA